MFIDNQKTTRRKVHKMKKILLFTLFVFILNGCSATLKEGIKIWCSGELPFFAELIEKEYQDPNDRARELMNVADLHCLWDIDKKISTTNEPSRACKCSNAKNEKERITECQKWAKEIREKGGCHEKI